MCAVHYNGRHPAIAKRSELLPKRGGEFALRSGHSTRNQGQRSGIIDCAPENSENGFRRYCASDSPYLKVFARAATLNLKNGKIFPQKLFHQSMFWKFLEVLR